MASKIKNIDLNKIIKYSFKQLVKDWKFFVWVGIIFYLISLLALPIIGAFAVAEKFISLILVSLIYFVFLLILEIIYQFYLYKCTLKNKKSFAMKFREMIKENRVYAGKFFLYLLLFALFFSVLFFVLPGILIYLMTFLESPLSTALITIITITTLVIIIKYAVSWQFYPFLLVDKINKKQQVKFIELLRNSENLVKGRWWFVFAINILEGLIITAFSLVVYLINLPLNIISTIFLSVPVVGIIVSVITGLISLVISFIVSFLQVPFKILYQGELFRQLRKVK